MEKWKDAEGLKGIVKVSDQGRLWNVRKNKEIIPYDNGNRYKRFSIRVDGKDRRLYVHRVVAKAFIPNPHNLKEVNHIDCNPGNNKVSNLEWVSSSGNTQHAMKVGRFAPWGNAPKPIFATNGESCMYFETISQAERYFNSRHIVQVLKGQRKTVRGWTFRYMKGGDRDADRPWETERKAGSLPA